VLALQKIMATEQSYVLNLGTGNGYSIREVISAVEIVTGRKVPYKIVSQRAGDPPILIADPSRAEKILGWKAKRNLETIVSTAWKWMQQTQAKSA
jgi:UDP-glucose 4-epimerase